MIIILKKKYKEHSHQTIENIKKMQAKHKKDLVQPRYEGEINPEFVREYGTKHLNPTREDVSRMAKKSLKLAALLDKKRVSDENNSQKTNSKAILQSGGVGR